MYNVTLHKNAAKFYQNTDEKMRRRIKEAVNKISDNPRFHVHIKKLEGELKHLYRYRLGDLRILYEIHEDLKTVRIKSIEGRGSVYK